MSLADQLHRGARQAPDRIALVADGDRLTYRQLATEADRVADLLVRSGVRPGDRVAVVLPNSAAAIAAIYGVWRAGACIVVAEPDSTEDHVRHRVAHSGAVAVITDAQRSRVVVPATASIEPRPLLVVTDGEVDGATPLAGHPAPSPFTAIERGLDEPMAIIYTSGSTGAPKGVTHSARSIGAVVAAVGEYLGHTEDDVVLCVLQLAFGYGLLQALVTFEHGGRLVLRRSFGLAGDLVEAIDAEGITGLAGVPTLFAMLSDLGPDALARCRRLRYLTCAAAALPPSLADWAQQAFPSTSLYVMHGQTECLRTTYLPPSELADHRGSVGRGMPGVELWLEAPDGERLPNGSEGELVVRGENVMLGYWDDPAATAAVVRPGRSATERELRTGDLFRTDADGWLYFVSRTDDVIKCRGQKVSPHEVEQVLAELPAVAECRVLGVPDPVQGQAVRAEIVVRAGHELTEAEVRRTFRGRLEPVKWPSQIEFVTALPKSSSGKIRRRG